MMAIGGTARAREIHSPFTAATVLAAHIDD
jgi:hypothetical protein